MQSKNIELRYDTLQKIHEIIPFVRTDEDLHFVADWVIIFGLASIAHYLDKNPQMTLADMILLTTQNADEIIN